VSDVLSGDAREALIAAALAARGLAYAPYSNFHVGAALLTAEGELFIGCNVENASYGMTTCAERVAVCNAISDGRREFAMLALATPGGAMPCGACRQVLAEFCDDLPILLIDTQRNNAVVEVALKYLLPGMFRLTTPATSRAQSWETPPCKPP
jgi:cytidine deaminase